MTMKLNLGCGDRYAPGWTNVDWEGCPHPKDQTVDLTGELPWARRSVSHVYAGHLLEHLTAPQAQGLLARLRPLMVKDGAIMVVGPDMKVARSMIDAGTFDGRYHSLESLRDGAARWPGDEHRWETAAADVKALLSAAGWVRISQHPIGDLGSFMEPGGFWPVADSAQLWQYAIGARRGS
jgi:hypothetical protein